MITKSLNKLLYFEAYFIISQIFSKFVKLLFTFAIGIQFFRDMLKRLMFAPVNIYFDITPSGVILNRFSKDFRIVEINLTHSVTTQIGTLLGIITHIALAAYNFIWILLITPIVIVSLIFYFKLFVRGMKEVTLLENITNSPIITHLNESNFGSTIIRVHGKIDQFEQKQYIL